MAKVIAAVLTFGALLTCGCESKDVDILTAIQRKDVDAVSRIVATGVDLEPASGLHDVNKPLAYAAAHGNLEIVKVLVDAGADLNGTVAYGDVPLIKADEHGNDDIVRYLIEQGADVNLPNRYGVTPFVGLCGGKNLEIVQLAAKHGGDVNSAFVATIGEGNGMKNFSPLQTAAFEGRLDIVELLLSLGSDPSKKVDQGPSPIELAKEKGHDDVVKLLQKHLESVEKD